MRRRETVKRALQRGDNESASSSFESRETSSLRLIKGVRKPLKGVSGRGLGKAGAKRLGRMLIQALQPGEEPKGRGKVSLPKTPIGLLEYHFQTDPNYASETDSPTLPSPQVSRFIGQAVSKYKREGGISMAELKQMLVAEGCDVNKNKQVNVVTKRLVNDEALVRTTRSASSRLNNKIKQNTTAHKICKGAEWSLRRGKKTPTPRGKSPKSKSKPNRAPDKPHNQPSKTRKCAAKFHEQRRETPKSNRKAPKPAGKKGRPTKNQTTQGQKQLKRTKRTQRRQAKQVQHLYKTRTRESPRRKGPRTRLRSRRDARRAYYS